LSRARIKHAYYYRRRNTLKRNKKRIVTVIVTGWTSSDNRKKRERERGKRNRVYMYVCDFFVMLLLSTGEKRVMLTNGIVTQFTRKFIIVSYYNHSPFIYSFSQITCVTLGVSVDLKNAWIQELPCSLLNTTKFMYTMMENVAIDIINHYFKKSATLHCVYLYHLEKAIDQETVSFF
jgi:hypothetical protein